MVRSTCRACMSLVALGVLSLPAPALSLALIPPPTPANPVAVLSGERYAGAAGFATDGASSNTSSISLFDSVTNGGTSGAWEAVAYGGVSPGVSAWAGAGNISGSNVAEGHGLADAQITYYILAGASAPLASPPAQVQVRVNYRLETSGFEQHEYLPVYMTANARIEVTAPGGGVLHTDYLQRSGGVNIAATTIGQADFSVPYGEWATVFIHANAYVRDGYGWTGLRQVGEAKAVVDPTFSINPAMANADLFEIVQIGIAAPVPAPPALLLAMTALAGVALRMRRRQKGARKKVPDLFSRLAWKNRSGTFCPLLAFLLFVGYPLSSARASAPCR